MIGKEALHAYQVIRARIAPLNAGVDPNDAENKLLLARDFTKVVMQVLVSLLVLSVALWLLVSSREESVLKLASGLTGTVIGYWLR
jgi:hypothetical protein